MPHEAEDEELDEIIEITEPVIIPEHYETIAEPQYFTPKDDYHKQHEEDELTEASTETETEDIYKQQEGYKGIKA